MTDAELLAEIEATPPAKRPPKLLVAPTRTAQVASGAPGRAQIVEVPGLGEIEFPAGMSDAEIVAAIKRMTPPNRTAPGTSAPQAKLSGRLVPPEDMPGGLVPAHDLPGRLSDAQLLAEIEATPAAGDPWSTPPTPAELAAAQGGLEATKTESAARGAFQGLSAGWGDELAAGVAAALPFTDREAAQGATLGERYRNARDFYRRLNAQAETANPGTYGTAQVVGAVAPALTGAGAAASGTKLLLRSAGQGAAQGLGYSEADTVGGLAKDAAIGTGLGVAGHAVGAGVQRAKGAVTRKAGEWINTARARAGAQAAQETAEQLASARGVLGAEVQKGSRYVENLMRLEASMTPEQRALYQQLQASGIVPNLQQSVAQGTLEKLPGQSATIAEAKALLQAMQAGAPEAVKGRTAALLTPQVRQDVRSFAKSYAEPVVASFLGYKAADALGADPETKAGAAAAAGLIFGRTRAGKALKARLTRPAHQLAIAEAMQSGADSKLLAALRAALQHGAPAVATDRLTED